MKHPPATGNRSVTFSRSIIIYITVALFLFFEMAVQILPSVSAIDLMRDFHINSFGLGLISSVYFYSYAAMQIPSGLLFDRYHPRSIVGISLAICCIGLWIFSMTTDSYVAALARLMMGTGSAFAFVSVLVVISDLFDTKRFALMAGFTQMLAGLGAGFGQSVFSLMEAHWGWRASSQILAIAGLMLCIGVVMILTYPREMKDHHSRKPILDDIKSVFRHPKTLTTALYACLLWAPMSGFASLWGMGFIQHAYGVSHSTAATMSCLMWMGIAIASPICGLLIYNAHRAIIAMRITAAVGLIAFILLIFLPIGIVWTSVFLVISGAACSGQVFSFAYVKTLHQPGLRSLALAMNNMAVVLSGVIIQPLIGWILHCSVAHHSHITLAHYQYALTPVILAYAAGTLISLAYLPIKNRVKNKKNRIIEIQLNPFKLSIKEVTYAK